MKEFLNIYNILALKIDGTICTTNCTEKDYFSTIYNTPKGNNIASYYYNSAALSDDGIIHVWGKRHDTVRKISAKIASIL